MTSPILTSVSIEVMRRRRELAMQHAKRVHDHVMRARALQLLSPDEAA